MNLSRRESPFYLEVAGATHIGGGRANNACYWCDDRIGGLAVAQGVSSRPAPRVAAETAIEALCEYLTDPNMTSPAEARERVERAFRHVHRRVREHAAGDEQLRGMATSLACVLERGRTILVGHVGEGRVIRFRAGQLEPLTREPAGTSAIGLEEHLVAEVSVEALRPNDGVLVGTAGLTAAFEDDAIRPALLHGSPHALVNELVRRAVACGTPDNVTCAYGYWRSILL